MKPSFFLIFLLSYLIGNCYVFIRIGQALPLHNNGMRIVFITTALILSSSVFIALIWGNQIPVALTSFLYNIGTGWLISLIYVFMFIALRDIILLADKFIHFFPKSISAHPGYQLTGMLIALGLAGIILLSGYIRYENKKRVEINIHTEKDLPENLKIVAISDMHLGYGIGKSELKKWVKLINAEQPDIVLIAGDIIDNSIRPLEKNNIETYLKEIHAPLGVYACPGNHEYISNIEKSTRFIEKSNIRLLKDSAVLINNAFYIIGRDDRKQAGRKTIQQLIQDIDQSKPLILLDHQPYHLEETARNRIDLQISGHTHRGQIWPISQITDRIYERSHGLLKKERSNIYVSSGIGIWGGKFRIGTQSEYIVIHINK